jgi:predicted DNA binding CopG/RHH family protein
MGGSSRKTLKKREETAMPKFKSETEEAEWYHSPEGRRWLETEERKTGGQKVCTVDKPLTFGEQMQIVRESGGQPVRFTKAATDLQFPDPVELQALIDRVKERSQPTLSISLRLSASDVGALKAWSKKNGVGYQTLIKEAVHALVQRLS